MKTLSSGRRSTGFTLIELLIVIGLLGALAVVVIPRIGGSREAALEQSLAPSEMMEIRRAFAAFQADCVPNAADRILIGQYGLEILMTFDESRGWSFPARFNPARGRGWRGPYLESQGRRTVYINESGQPLSGTGSTAIIPVVHDPRHTRNALNVAERFYRVLHEPTTGHLALVYLGVTDVLEAAPNSAATAATPFHEAFLNHHQTEDDGFSNILHPLGVR
jgi:prepilin-type N-terminal cleavage/methylation domain-containing protein